MKQLQITIVNGAVSILQDGQGLAQGSVEFSDARDPRPVGITWTAWLPRTPMARQQVADLVGFSDETMARIEAETLSIASGHAAADSARIEQGRRDWAQMNREDRDAMNEYAIRTEGHSID